MTLKTLNLRGNFPLVFYLENDGFKLPAALAIDIYYCEYTSSLNITYCEQISSCGFELLDYRYELSGLEKICLECSESTVVFQTLSFSQNTHLDVLGHNNTVKLINCALSHLTLTTSRQNSIQFDQQPVFNSIDATLWGTLITGLKVRGKLRNTFKARHHSAIELSIGLSKENRRTFSFEKDNTSLITVKCSQRGSREVVEESELWSISGCLDSIVPVNELPSYELDMPFESLDSKSRPSCAVCFCALPEMLIEPCKHLCLCPHCANDIHGRNMRTCPICRSNIDRVTQVIVSCS